MTIENLGDPFLGATRISEAERTAWPDTRFLAPKAITFNAAESVTNEVYFSRSTAYKRAAELLGADVFYMVYHIGVPADPKHFPVAGAGIVAVDDDAGADVGGQGYYHDASNGRMLAEHVRDPAATLNIKGGGATRTVRTVCHFHVVGYGNSADDSYKNLDFEKLYMVDVGTRPDLSQMQKLKSFGTGVRQFLPTYWLIPTQQGSTAANGVTNGAASSSCRLRVPGGLKARRSYELKPELGKHHIYYLNFPGSEFYVDDASYR